MPGPDRVIDADLSKYFDTIPHADLLLSVARRIVDRHVLHDAALRRGALVALATTHAPGPVAMPFLDRCR